MRKDDLKPVLDRLSDFDSRYGKLGLHVFIERGLSWFDDYRLLIRGDVIIPERFEEFEALLVSLGLKWSLKHREEESYIVIHSMPFLYCYNCSTWDSGMGYI